jgi:hypothetical protein
LRIQSKHEDRAVKKLFELFSVRNGTPCLVGPRPRRSPAVLLLSNVHRKV